MAGIALSVAVMIISVCVVTGFKNEITNKVSGFASHIRITAFNSNSSYEEEPVNRNQSFVQKLKSINDIKHIQVYATKAGILKTESDLQGIIVKGLDTDFDNSFFSGKIKQGALPQLNDTAKTNSILISSKIASLLKLGINDNAIIYFIGDKPRARKFIICGIYETGLEEFDNIYLFADIKIIQQLNGWSPSQVGGFEITVNDFAKVEEINQKVYSMAGYTLNSQTIRDLYPQIFNWLEMQDINVIIILVLMMLVSGINMISTLLIIVLENTPAIGLLKSMGAGNWSVRRIFLLIAALITTAGIAGGNILGILLCWLQKKYHIISLPLESYYMNYVPVNISASAILLISCATLIICILMLLIPVMIISRISAAKVLRYE